MKLMDCLQSLRLYYSCLLKQLLLLLEQVLPKIGM
ncbi:hypothetical protein LSH36_511g00044 [Paralvinella palmiformis]|uniref:Uncharacterized protein n=1 Tax=Paralvinella palmiformis TaxID=53620 RepID=A0AAD9J940_9ANNE|nr:hypothetical protein LSH36_511g00044 [Paralvinella palmiformis]